MDVFFLNYLNMYLEVPWGGAYKKHTHIDIYVCVCVCVCVKTGILNLHFKGRLL